MARILCISTYPARAPRHGGQIRVNAIQRALRNDGHLVEHLAVFRKEFYQDEPESIWNVHFSWPFINHLTATGGRDDVNAADFLFVDFGARDRVTELICTFKPDIIQLEHCWLWPFIKALLASNQRLRGCQVIYSSQNVEFQLLAESVGSSRKTASSDILEPVRRMELDLVEAAAVVVAVSASDAAEFERFAKRVIVAPNGIWPRAQPSGFDYWQREVRGRKTALFVGSAHPPNAVGFMSMLGPTLAFLSPTEKIIVVGEVCNLLRIDPRFRKGLGLNMARVILAGSQDEGGLSSLIELADVVIVPITEGGGTNIKMAEALYNRKTIVCTPKAFRGYEAYEDFPNLHICATPQDFRASLVSVLRTAENNRVSLNRSHAMRLRSLVWSSTLLPLNDAVRELMAKPTAAWSSKIRVNQ